MKSFEGTDKMPTKREVNLAMESLGVLYGKMAPEDCKYLGKPPAKRQQHEAQEQAALFQWAKMNEGKLAVLRLMFAVPNGATRKGGAIEGAHLKAQGVRAGAPNVCLPTPSGPYHGLFIELRAKNGRVQESQTEWLNALNKQGYRAVVCYGFETAKLEIIKYLEMGCS